ncbi:MAG: transposase [Omnitrophica bacterium]|nr:transposase [Candidatus Omnitrophota bacterium]
MSTKYTRRASSRLMGYDYSTNGIYYITICAVNRQCIFGKIDNNMPVGAGLAPARRKGRPQGSPLHAPAHNIAPVCIELTEIGQIIDTHWRNIPNQYKNIEIDGYIIMPNHIHGILIKRATARVAPTSSLGQIIGSFKSKCAIDCLKYIRKNNLNKSAKIWQRSFYDHIIRDERSLHKIRKYIINNPLTWQFDIEHRR